MPDPSEDSEPAEPSESSGSSGASSAAGPAATREPFDTGLRPEDLDPERPRTHDTPWGAFFLVEVAGRVVAVGSWCPHMTGPLWEGSFRDGRVTCPWHSWVFSLETGECMWRPDGEPTRARLRFAPVSVGPGGTLRVHAPEK